MKFRHLWRSETLALGLAGLLTLLLAADVRAAESRSAPNIVVILADDLGYGDLACCGASDMKTPHLDKLFARGMRLPHFRASCPVCSPTRAALLTGRYPDRVGVPGVIRTDADNSWGWLSPEAILLPKLLEPAGYRNALVGKWHLGLESPNTPGERGFAHFHGFLGDMMDDYYTHRRHNVNYMRKNGETIDPKGHATDLFTTWACEFLKEQKPDKPFFLYLAYNAPHTPIQPPEDWLARVKKREQGITERRAKLVALIEHMDDGIGQVLATLASTGLADNTIVVFTSDNGGQLDVGANNGPLRGGKQMMYEGGLKVPAAVVWPGHIKPGSSSDWQALTMDLLPTLLEAAGVPVKHPIDGVSFLPTLLGKEQPTLKRELYFTRREGGNAYGGKTIDALIDGNWKILQNSPWQPLELYNLRDDPKEANNLAAKEKDKFNELSAALRKQIQRGGAVSWQPPARR
ncbi:MAG: sulfatase-like hydrolase/transferase [Gemmataceae bacterium]